MSVRRDSRDPDANSTRSTVPHLRAAETEDVVSMITVSVLIPGLDHGAWKRISVEVTRVGVTESVYPWMMTSSVFVTKGTPLQTVKRMSMNVR